MISRKIIIEDVCDLNLEAINSTNTPVTIQYLDTSSITRNLVNRIQVLDSRVSSLPSRARRKVRNGTIVYSTVRPNLEHYGFLDAPEENLIVSTGFVTIDVKDDEIDPKFLYYAITQKHITEYLHTIAANSVSSYPSINPSDIGGLEFEIPKQKTTQRTIASVLSSLDSKIENNNQVIVELEAMAKCIYHYWFTQYDFPNKKGKPYRLSGGEMKYDNQLNEEIPSGWRGGFASDLFDFNPALTLKKDSPGSYVDMDALSETGFMTDAIQKKMYNGGVKFKNGDLVIARITPCLENGKTGLITLLNEGEVGFGSTEFIVLRGKKQPLSSFAACLSRSELFRKYAITNMTGTSGRKRVEADALARFPMAIPLDDLLEEFENTVGSFFKIATTNVKQNQQLAQLRDWLLPMLMNGQVKVADIREELSMAAEGRVEYKVKKQQKV